MQLEHEKPDTNIYVKHYKSGSIRLAQESFNHSIIITPDAIINNNWKAQEVAQLTLDDFEPLFEVNASIYLLGTGMKAHIPPSDIITAFARLGKSLDFMDSAAACRTFNILANEGRRVIAAIIV